mgnify:CR=1 FL=1
MANRFNKRRVAVNKSSDYENSDIFENRGVKKIKQYDTPVFRNLTKEQYDSVPFHRHYWTNGDRLWKLANLYYNDPNLWWLIARWNFKPTESHFNEGDELRIPKIPKEALELIE